MAYRNTLTAMIVAAGAWAASVAPAAALPTFVQGSFGLTFQTDTTADLSAAFTVFHMTGGSFGCQFLNGGNPCFDVQSNTGSFSSVTMPFILKVAPSVSGSGNNLNFGNANNFDWDTTATATNIGKFHGLSTSFVSTVTTPGPHTVVSWNVQGNYTVGSEFANAGKVLSGIETWSLTQTGGGGQTISASGTFFSPDQTRQVPEPASIALLGAALLGAGAAGRRKVKKA
jgi:hypothetical protein